MDFNNNNENFNNSRGDFFQEIDSENLKTSNISGSGISYGGEKNDNTKMLLMVFFILFAVVLLIIMGIKLSNRQSRNNTAEIPVIEGYKDARVEHEMPKPNEVYDASIYKRDKGEEKDFVKKEEIETHIPPVVKEVEAVKTVTVQKPRIVKPAVVKTEKKIVQKPKIKILKQNVVKPKIVESRIVEKKTEVEGEVEMISQPMNSKVVSNDGAWYVQIVSTLSEVSANNAWIKLKGQHPQIFTGVKHKVFKSVINGKTYYRLRAIGFDINSATTFCNNLKAVNLSCFVGK